MELTHQDVKSIISLIEGAEHLNEIELVYGGFRLHVHRGSSGESMQRASAPPPARIAPSAAQSPVAVPVAPPPAKPAALASNEIAVRAPMLGTYYRAPSPGEKPFVEVGQRVKASDDVGVIEVMKLFKTIQAGVDGTVVRIEAENAALVEFDQALVVIARD